MKVHIGPYPDMEGHIEEQEVDIHINRWDTWSMDYTLGLIALPMLKQLKEEKQGAPNVDLEDVPEELWPEKGWAEKYRTNGETDPNFFKRWDWIMDEMIFAFETKSGSLQEWEDQFQSGTHDLYFQPLDKDDNPIGEPKRLGEKDDVEGVEFYQVVKGPNDTFEIDWDGRKAYQERISNGFRLFGKYYESLWD